MNVQLEPGEMIAITTPQGIIVINVDAETGGTLARIAYNQGYKLTPKLSRNQTNGAQDALVWIEPE